MVFWFFEKKLEVVIDSIQVLGELIQSAFYS